VDVLCGYSLWAVVNWCRWCGLYGGSGICNEYDWYVYH